MAKETQNARAATPRAVGTDRKKAPRVDKTLSKDVVIAAALEEIDRGGLENFSLRNLAKALGIYPTAVTWYVPGRRQILAEVVRLTLENILPPGFHSSWQDYLRIMFERFRDTIRRHPNVAPLIGTQLVANPVHDFDFIEGLLSALSHAGFSGTPLVSAYNTVIAAMVGFVTQEFAPLPSEETEDWREATKKRLQTVPAQKYPVLAKNMGLLRNKAFTLRWQNGIEAPLDASFNAFVDVIIRGLESVLAAQNKR